MSVLPDCMSHAAASPEAKLKAALYWQKWGLQPVPVMCGLPVVEWGPWLQDLTPAKIRAAWRVNPNFDVGAILDDRVLVLISRRRTPTT